MSDNHAELLNNCVYQFVDGPAVLGAHVEPMDPSQHLQVGERRGQLINNNAEAQVVASRSTSFQSPRGEDCEDVAATLGDTNFQKPPMSRDQS